MKRIFYAATILLMVSSPLAPAYASAPTGPTGSIGTMELTIDGSGLTITRSGTPTFSAGTIVYQLFACSTPENGETSASASNGPRACNELTDSSGNPFTGNSLNDAYRLTGTNPNRYSRYNTDAGQYITYTAKVVDTFVPYFVYPPSVRALGPIPSAPPGQNSGQSSAATVAPTEPTKYRGPEFVGLSKMEVSKGGSATIEGKLLDEISTIEINGKAASFSAISETELVLAIPADLTPGNFDLVINSSAGKLTHLDAIRVKEPREGKSFTTKSSSELTPETIAEHIAFASNQASYINRIRCTVNSSDLAEARKQAVSLCAKIVASNPRIVTSIVEAKSTIRSNHVFARVSYGWNK